MGAESSAVSAGDRLGCDAAGVSDWKTLCGLRKDKDMIAGIVMLIVFRKKNNFVHTTKALKDKVKE